MLITLMQARELLMSRALAKMRLANEPTAVPAGPTGKHESYKQLSAPHLCIPHGPLDSRKWSQIHAPIALQGTARAGPRVYWCQQLQVGHAPGFGGPGGRRSSSKVLQKQVNTELQGWMAGGRGGGNQACARGWAERCRAGIGVTRR